MAKEFVHKDLHKKLVIHINAKLDDRFQYKDVIPKCNLFNKNRTEAFIYFSDLDTVPKDWTLRINLQFLRIEAYPPAWLRFKDNKEAYREISKVKRENKYLLSYTSGFKEKYEDNNRD
jgi:hypothetical protein